MASFKIRMATDRPLANGYFGVMRADGTWIRIPYSYLATALDVQNVLNQDTPNPLIWGANACTVTLNGGGLTNSPTPGTMDIELTGNGFDGQKLPFGILPIDPWDGANGASASPLMGAYGVSAAQTVAPVKAQFVLTPSAVPAGGTWTFNGNSYNFNDTPSDTLWDASNSLAAGAITFTRKIYGATDYSGASIGIPSYSADSLVDGDSNPVTLSDGGFSRAGVNQVITITMLQATGRQWLIETVGTVNPLYPGAQQTLNWNDSAGTISSALTAAGYPVSVAGTAGGGPWSLEVTIKGGDDAGFDGNIGGGIAVATYTLENRAVITFSLLSNGSGGTPDYPSAGDVRNGTTFDSGAQTGTLVVPATSDVRDGTAFDTASGSTGTLELPAQSDVKQGVGYGAGGTEFTGTLVSGGVLLSAGAGFNGGFDQR